MNRIYSGLLRYVRPAPDYSRSDATSVILCMSNAESDMDFLEPIIWEENRQGASMPLDSLIILSRLRQERRISINDILLIYLSMDLVVSYTEKWGQSGDCRRDEKFVIFYYPV